MVSAASKGAAVKQSNEAKKAPTPREDPIARAERLLQETKERVKVTAAKQLVNAEKELEIADRNLERATRVQAERTAKVAELKRQAGIADENEAVSLADAIALNTADGVDKGDADTEAQAKVAEVRGE